MTAVQFKMNSGNMDTGKIKLYGIKGQLIWELYQTGTTLLDAGALDSGVATGAMTLIKTLTASNSANLSFVEWCLVVWYLMELMTVMFLNL